MLQLEFGTSGGARQLRASRRVPKPSAAAHPSVIHSHGRKHAHHHWRENPAQNDRHTNHERVMSLIE